MASSRKRLTSSVITPEGNAAKSAQSATVSSSAADANIDGDDEEEDPPQARTAMTAKQALRPQNAGSTMLIINYGVEYDGTLLAALANDRQCFALSLLLVVDLCVVVCWCGCAVCYVGQGGVISGLF